MIKIRVYKQVQGFRDHAGKSETVADYCYCVYLFGIMIHSITI